MVNGIKIGEKLRDIREENGFNQEQIANKIGVSRSTYSKYESGESEISLFNAIKLAKFYNVQLDYLCGRERYVDYDETRNLSIITEITNVNTINHFDYDDVITDSQLKVIMIEKIINNEIIPLRVNDDIGMYEFLKDNITSIELVQNINKRELFALNYSEYINFNDLILPNPVIICEKVEIKDIQENDYILGYVDFNAIEQTSYTISTAKKNDENQLYLFDKNQLIPDILVNKIIRNDPSSDFEYGYIFSGNKILRLVKLTINFIDNQFIN